MVSTLRPTSALAESLTCFTLALREAVRPGLALVSIVIGAISLGLWLLVFSIWGGRIVHWCDLLSNAILGRLSGQGASPSVLMLSVGRVFAYLFATALFIILVMVTVRILLEFILMARIQRYCLARYPSLRTGVPSSMTAGVRDAIGATATLVIGGLLCLVIPIIGGVLFFVLASYLNVRGLVNDAVDGLARDEQRRAIIETRRVEMTMLGVLVGVFTLVPFAGFLSPVVLGAGVCHLSMRALADADQKADGRARGVAAAG
jgi:uncharacterized protein involved in cysteine biosynthesis